MRTVHQTMLFCCGTGEERKSGMFSNNQWDDDGDDDDDDVEDGMGGTSSREEKILQSMNLHRVAHAKKRQTVYAACSINVSEDYTPPHYEKSEQEFKFIDEALGDNFIFSHLKKEDRKCLINAMQKELADKSTDIIQQGDVTGEYFYVLQKGEVQFIADQQTVGTGKEGGSFGELALLYDCPRSATCKATEDCVLWKVDRTTFRHMLAQKAHEAEQGVNQIIDKIEILSGLSKSDKIKFGDALTPVSYAENERIVNKGDVGEVFYIIKEGSVKCHDIGLGDSQFVDQTLSTGDWFGERSLITGDPRAAHVTALTDTVCLCLSRERFESTFGSLTELMKVGMRKKFLKTLPIFANSRFEKHEVDQLAECMSEQCFRQGDYLCQAGKPYQSDLWILRTGKVLVTHKSGKIFKLKPGDYFGDKSIKGDDPEHISSHTAIFEQNTTCFVLQRSDIIRVIGDINRLGEYVPFVPSVVNKSIKFKHLKQHRVLGMGAFGKVWLVTRKKNNTPYALKQLSKRQLIQAGQVKGVLREKNVMYSIEHPFLLSLVSSFQNEDSLYLLLELVQGGELFNVVHTEKKDGVTDSHAKFYSACVLEALGHLHQRNICYRDLKPENVLIDSKGYCVVVDMGFAKVVVDKTYTLCGTPEYLAPEIIMSKGHDKAVDYWSFGVLVFELLVGRSPFYFYGTDQISLFKRIVMVKYQVPKLVCTEAKDMIQKLLVRRQATRFGNLSGGHRDVMKHDWYESINFRKLVKKELPAPWIPEIKNPLDSSHFEDFSQHEGQERYRTKLERSHQELFKEF